MTRFGRARAVILEEDPFTRLTLTQLLEREGIEVLAALPLDEHALRAALELTPDLAIVGLEPLGPAASKLIRRLVRSLPGCRVLALAASRNGSDIASARRAGARVTLYRDGPAGDLVATVCAACPVPAPAEP